MRSEKGIYFQNLTLVLALTLALLKYENLMYFGKIHFSSLFAIQMLHQCSKLTLLTLIKNN